MYGKGLSVRFGLYEADYETLERKIRKIGMFYAELCKNNEVTEEMIETYL